MKKQHWIWESLKVLGRWFLFMFIGMWLGAFLYYYVFHAIFLIERERECSRVTQIADYKVYVCEY